VDAERKEILTRYMDHSRRFEAAAARRSPNGSAEVIPFTPPMRELEQEPTMREIEVPLFLVPALAAQRLYAMYQEQRRLAEDLSTQMTHSSGLAFRSQPPSWRRLTHEIAARPATPPRWPSTRETSHLAWAFANRSSKERT